MTAETIAVPAQTEGSHLPGRRDGPAPARSATRERRGYWLASARRGKDGTAHRAS